MLAATQKTRSPFYLRERSRSSNSYFQTQGIRLKGIRQVRSPCE
ncbi:hypothetical protein [Nostoc sp. DSM 114167]